MRARWICFSALFAAGWPTLDAPLASGRDGTDDVAVFVGIERFRNLAPNRGGRADADRAAAWAKQGAGIPSARVQVLHDPACAEVRAALDQTAAQAHRDGTLWVGWSGHAVPLADGGLGLLCADAPADPDALGRAVFPLADLERRLAALDVRRVVLWLDVDPGAADREGEALFFDPVPPIAPLEPAPPAILRWIPASTPFGAHNLLGQGLLSYAMIAGLSGWADVDGDGVVRVGELAGFVPALLERAGRGDARIETPSPGDERPLVAPVVGRAPDLSTARPLRAPEVDLQDRFLPVSEGGARFVQEAEALRAQVQAAADADWARTLARAALGPEEATLAYRLFLDRYASRTYVLEGGEVTITAEQVQEARARLGRGGQPYRAIEVVAIPPGEGRFGHAPGNDSLPFRTTTPLLVATHEITQAQWVEVMGTTPAGSRSPGHPVTGVGWTEAIAFANARSRIDGLQPAYSVRGSRVLPIADADGWRLPTEAEWWVISGGLELQAPCEVANLLDLSAEPEGAEMPEGGCDDGAPKLTRGGAFLGHRGVHDLIGNVAEWTWDAWSPSPPTGRLDPVAERADPRRVVVGGSWRTPAAQAWQRRGLDAEQGADDVGFRLVRRAPAGGLLLLPDVDPDTEDDDDGLDVESLP